ncbi:hypothetical protein [Brachyspira sp.]
MSITNKLLIAGFILLCIYAIISRIVNNRDRKNNKDNEINKNENDKENKD